MSTDEEARVAELRTGTLGVYEAIGRFVFAFSMFEFWMRQWMKMRFVEPQRWNEIGLLIAETNGYQLVNPYFALCREVADLTDDEKRVGGKLREATIKEIIEKRNNLMHGLWMPAALDDGNFAQLMRTKPARAEPSTTDAYNAKEIDALTETLTTIGNHVIEFGEICLTDHHGSARVSDFFTVSRGGAIERNGPKAAQRWQSFLKPYLVY